MSKIQWVLLLILSLYCLQTNAQNNNSKNQDIGAIMAAHRHFYDQKIGEVFAPMDEWKCINGQHFDLYSTKRQAVIFFGFDTCAPCRQALPILAALADEPKYADVDFVYITFDDSATVYDELNKAKIERNNIKMVSLPKEYLTKNYVHGYPAVYVLNKDKSVQTIGGIKGADGSVTKKEDWYAWLSQLK